MAGPPCSKSAGGCRLPLLIVLPESPSFLLLRRPNARATRALLVRLGVEAGREIDFTPHLAHARASVTSLLGAKFRNRTLLL